MTITLPPLPAKHNRYTHSEVQTYATAAVELNRVQQGEPVAWMSPGKERLEFSRPDTVYGSHTIPLYTAPQPVHTEAEVQHLMLCVADWDVERSQYEALVRSILGVPK